MEPTKQAIHPNSYSKDAPQNIDVERRVLCTAMQDKKAALRVVEGLGEHAFYDRKNKAIFKAITKLVNEGVQPDLISVTAELDRRGQDNLTKYLNNVFSLGAVGFGRLKNLSKLLKEKQMLRGFMAIQQHIGRELDEGADPFELQERVEAYVMNNNATERRTRLRRAGESYDDVIELFELAEQGDGVLGLETGFGPIDARTHGMMEGDYWIDAGDSGMGKTSFALNVCHHQAVRRGNPVAYYSTEMEAKRLMMRMLCLDLEIDRTRALSGDLKPDEWERIREAKERFQGIDFFVNDARGLTLSRFEAEARRAIKYRGVKLVVLDYIQNMHTSDNRVGEREVAAVSGACKKLALETGAVVMGLSQITIHGEGDRRPAAHHLRGSKMLRNDADVVGLVYRPEEYGIEHSEKYDIPTKGLVEWICGKQREGDKGFTVPMTWVGRYGLFKPGAPAQNEELPF